MRPVSERLPMPSGHEVAPTLDRRRLLVLGGAGVGAAALLAACGDDLSGTPTRVGQAPVATELPPVTITDVVRLRTASSMEHTLIGVYDQVIGHADLLDPAHDDLATRLRDDHATHVAALAALTTAAGGEVWACPNPRLQSTVIDPAMARITTGDEAAKIPASEDPKRDVLNLLNALESLSSETCQEMVGTLNTPALRGEVFAVGIAAARRAAALALAANPQRPGAYVSSADAANAGVELPAVTTTTVASAGPPLTEIPAVSAIPSQFGQLGPVFLVVGNGDENGVRFKANLETPHDNSLIYEGMAASC